MGDEIDLGLLEEIIDKSKADRWGLIPVLQKAQNIYGYLPKPVLKDIAVGLCLSKSRVYGVATFYSQFHLEPRGRHLIQQCDGTACHIRGAKQIIRAIENELGIKIGDTTDDLFVTYDVIHCLGSCSLAPSAMIDGKVIGNLTIKKMKNAIAQLN